MKPELRQWFDNNLENFEQALCQRLLTDKEFFEDEGAFLREPNSHVFYSESSIIIRLVLKATIPLTEIEYPVKPALFVTMLESVVAENADLFQDVEADAAHFYQAIYEGVDELKAIYGLIPELMGAWYRFGYFRNESGRLNLQADVETDFYGELQRLQDQLMPDSGGGSLARRPIRDYWELQEEKNIHRIPIRHQELNEALGGGFGQREAYLAISAPGGGKTVFACNTTTDAVKIRKKAIYISTEQYHDELMPRFIADACNIPFNPIKDCVTGKSLIVKVHNQFGQAKLNQVKEYIDLLDAYARFYNWSEISTGGLSGAACISRAFKNGVKELGSVDLVVLDWIGGALGALGESDKIRHMYQEASDTMVALARKEEVAALSLAQAEASRGKNTMYVDSNMTAECKSQDRGATAAIGISAIQNRAANNVEAEFEKSRDTYAREQFFYIGKSRKAPGGLIPFKRNFETQTMAPITMSDTPLKRGKANTKTTGNNPTGVPTVPPINSNQRKPYEQGIANHGNNLF